MYTVLCVLAVLSVLFGSSSAMAQPATSGATTSPVAAVTSQRGGTIAFVGAVVVATATRPLLRTVAAPVDGGVSAHGARSPGPSRAVTYRHLMQDEVSSQLHLLERAGEDFSQPVEAVVAYQ